MHGFLALDRTSWWHLARALERHRVACRVDGIRLPAALEELARHAAMASRGDESARSRQEPPSGTGDPGLCSPDHVVATTPSLLLSALGVADVLGCGERTAERLVADGVLPSLRLGRLRRVRLVDVERYVDGLVGEGDGGEAA